MELGSVPVNSLEFWLFTALAIVTLNLLRDTAVRRFAWAAINLGFLGLLLHTLVIAVALGVGIFYGLLYLIQSERVSRPGAAAALAALLSLFVINKLGGIDGVSLPADTPLILAAIGFSFVALRAVEVVRAVYERRAPLPDIVDLVNYLVPFHMLAAGPIQAFDDFRRPSEAPPMTKSIALEGIELITNGLVKKFVLAYAVKSVFLTDFNSSGAYLLFEALMFLLWLYLDFSAYSDIALGIGRLANIPTPENFNSPLIARNLVDFWDRWHISLSLFIRRNIFIPIQLGLMRRDDGLGPIQIAAIATSISFLLCGLWHGLTWGWLAWGAMHAVGLIAVRLYGNILSKHFTPLQLVAYRESGLARVASTALTYIYVSVAFLPVFLIGRGS